MEGDVRRDQGVRAGDVAEVVQVHERQARAPIRFEDVAGEPLTDREGQIAGLAKQVGQVIEMQGEQARIGNRPDAGGPLAAGDQSDLAEVVARSVAAQFTLETEALVAEKRLDASFQDEVNISSPGSPCRR